MAATFWWDWKPARVLDARDGYGAPERGIRGLAGEIGPQGSASKPRGSIRGFFDEAMHNLSGIHIDKEYCLYMGGTTSELQAALAKDRRKGTEGLFTTRETMDIRFVRRKAGALKGMGAAHTETVVGIAPRGSYWDDAGAEMSTVRAAAAKAWCQLYEIEADAWETADIGFFAFVHLDSLGGLLGRCQGIDAWAG